MVDRIYWTRHALLRVVQRGLFQGEVERVIRQGHSARALNRGEADWRIYGTRSDGRRFVVVYDSPALGDPAAARIVSVWVLRDRVQL
jgi:hypothetical protein